MVLKRPRREDQLAPRLQATMSMVPHVQGIDLMPTIRGVHEHTSTWMSSLINAQDGCLQAVAHRASMGRSRQEHLAHQVALRSTMPSTNNQVAYLRAQLALRDAQIEQVKAERDSHFVQEEEVLAHMRLLSSEAKDWKSRLVTEAEEVLCRESAHVAHQATEAQENIIKLNGSRQRPTLQLYVNPTAYKCSLLPPRCMRPMQNIKSFMMHKRDEFNSRHKPFEKLINMNNKQRIQLRSIKIWYTNYDVKLTNSRTCQKLLWKRQLSQQADYRAEIHELHTELLNMRERPICPQQAVHQPDELNDAHSPLAPLQQEPLVAARCVNGTPLRPGNAEEEPPSTACRQSEVCAPGGVPLGRGAPGQQQSPGGLRGRNLNPPVPPPPPPPPHPPVPHASAAPSAVTYPLQWTPAYKAKSSRRRRRPTGRSSKPGRWQHQSRI